MRIAPPLCVIALPLMLGVAAPASAQRVAFERTYAVGASPTLDVSTIRGKITISGGDENRVLVRGTATVRWSSPTAVSAYELAKRVAANPPIEQDGNIIRLRPPSGADEQRALTVSYDVSVPRDAQVRALSDSGETTVAGVAGGVSIRTGSAAIEVRDLGSHADVTTDSGTVQADGVAGDLRVSTQSSSVQVRNLGAGLRVRTQSGAVEGSLRGQGAVDVETGSSAIDLAGINGGLMATSRSGRIRLSGAPTAAWQVTSGSGSFDLDFDSNAKLTLDARSGSGNVRIEGSGLQGSTSKGAASGTIGGGGPIVRATSRSGSIRIGLR